MAKKTKRASNYTITKQKDSVNIELSNDAYNHLHEELKAMITSFCNSGLTLLEIGNHCPIAMMLMSIKEVLDDLNIGDKIHEK